MAILAVCNGPVDCTARVDDTEVGMTGLVGDPAFYTCYTAAELDMVPAESRSWGGPGTYVKHPANGCVVPLRCVFFDTRRDLKAWRSLLGIICEQLRARNPPESERLQPHPTWEPDASFGVGYRLVGFNGSEKQKQLFSHCTARVVKSLQRWGSKVVTPHVWQAVVFDLHRPIPIEAACGSDFADLCLFCERTLAAYWARQQLERIGGTWLQHDGEVWAYFGATEVRAVAIDLDAYWWRSGPNNGFALSLEDLVEQLRAHPPSGEGEVE